MRHYLRPSAPVRELEPMADEAELLDGLRDWARRVRGGEMAPAEAEDLAAVIERRVLRHPDERLWRTFSGVGTLLRALRERALRERAQGREGENVFGALWLRTVERWIAEAREVGVWLTPQLLAVREAEYLGPVIERRRGAEPAPPSEAMAEYMREVGGAIAAETDALRLVPLTRILRGRELILGHAARPMAPALAMAVLASAVGAQAETGTRRPRPLSAGAREQLDELVAEVGATPEGVARLRAWLLVSEVRPAVRGAITRVLHLRGVGLDETERMAAVVMREASGGEARGLERLAAEARLVADPEWAEWLLDVAARDGHDGGHEIHEALAVAGEGAAWGVAMREMQRTEPEVATRLLESADAAQLRGVAPAVLAALLARVDRESRMRLLRLAGGAGERPASRAR